MSKSKKTTGGRPENAPGAPGAPSGPAAGTRDVRRDETDSFIDEVTEELQKDQLYRQFRTYGPYAIGLIVVIVLAAAIFEYRQGAQQSAAQEAGEALAAAAEADDPVAAYLDLAQSGGSGLSVIARFRAADARVEAGDAAGAAALLDEVAADTDVSPLYRDLAVLKASMARLGVEDAQRITDALQPLTAPQNALRPLALELRAAALLELGETDAARAALADAIADETAPQGVRTRAQALLDALGGPVDGASDAAPLDPAAGGGDAADPASDETAQ